MNTFTKCLKEKEDSFRVQHLEEVGGIISFHLSLLFIMHREVS